VRDFYGPALLERRIGDDALGRNGGLAGAAYCRIRYAAANPLSLLSEASRCFFVPRGSRWVMCGRRPQVKGFWRSACGRVQVMCPACLRGANSRWP
jgi:hypothetical protein